MLEIFIILLLSGITYFQVRDARAKKFVVRIIYAEYLKVVDMRKRGDLNVFNMDTLWAITDRLRPWRVIFSFRPLKYENYIMPDELVELRPYLERAEARQASGEPMVPQPEDYDMDDETALGI